MFLWIWLAVAVLTGWLWLKKTYSYFKDRGVNCLPPVMLVGNSGKIFTKQEHLTTALERLYKSFPKDRFIGSFEITSPIVLVTDPDLLRLIGTKEFDHFTDHRSLSSSDNDDQFFSKSLFSLKGQKWRDMRSTLSPAFTGSKLRNMVPLILESNKDLVDYLLKEIDQTSDDYIDVDTRDLLTRYTNDVIATCAFGIKTNSINDRDNEFYKMGKEVTTFGTIQLIKIFIMFAFPFINKIIKVNLFPKHAVNFLEHIVLSTMKNREDNNLFRPDMIQLLLEAKKGTLKHENVNDVKDAGFATVEESSIGKNTIKQAWTDDYLSAQALLFFFAGFDTIATALNFLLLELAINPDIQDKLLQEIEEHYEKYEGKIEYDKINQMKYMDMVVSETLRKWPPAINTDRLCVKNFNMGKPNDTATKDFIMEKGISLSIPIWSIHRDPKYFPDPERFDPERFSDDNKHNIKPNTYLPFGIGPRNCIGSRFALVEVKVLVYELIRRFELSPAPQMKLPPRLDKKQSVALRLEGGQWLRFKIRN